MLSYAFTIGGAGTDLVNRIAVDAPGSAYVTGETDSSDFPTTTGAYDGVLGGPKDAFVAKLNAAGTGLAWSTHLGGTFNNSSAQQAGEERGLGVDVDGAGNVYVPAAPTRRTSRSPPGHSSPR